MLYIILFVIVVLAVRALLLSVISKEKFIPSLSLVLDEKPDRLTLHTTKSLTTSASIQLLQDKIKNLRFVEEPSLQDLEPISHSVIIDAFTAYQQKQSQPKFLTTTNTESVALFIRPLEIPNSLGFVSNGVRIGYFNDLDKQLIKTIMASKKSNETMSTYTMKKVSLSSQSKPVYGTKLFEDNEIDVLFIYENLDSEGIVRSIDNNLKLEVWDYADTLDIHKLKVIIPFIKHKNIDFSLVFPQLKGKLDIVSSVIAFDNIILVSPNDAANSNVATEAKKLVHYFNKPETINFYERYFPTSPISLEFAKEKNSFFLKRDDLQVLEQYSEPNQSKTFTFEINENVNGFYDAQSQLFYVYTNSITGIPLKEGSVFSFKQQMREDQNGVYSVSSVSPKQSILKRVGDLSNPNQTPSQSIIKQPGYLCYNRPDITSKAACDSKYDFEGNLKKQQTYWDKPCEKHTDCPFYQANKNYNNYRGGCIDGRCEMPIGIKAASYRLYDKDASKPFCHNCNSSFSLTASALCCQDQQENPKKYPSLKGPDYAFELDEFERSLPFTGNKLGEY